MLIIDIIARITCMLLFQNTILFPDINTPTNINEDAKNFLFDQESYAFIFI